MIWLTWRQFRTQTWIAVGSLAAIAIVLLINGHTLAHDYATQVGDCRTGCSDLVGNFLSDVRRGAADKIYNYGTVIMYIGPALIGIFWGAPLIARELETGTHRLVWNQSVTRTRWLATKLAIIGTASAGAMGLLSLGLTSWAHHIDHANNNRITPLIYDARGVVPIGHVLFAFALGVTAGMLIRRTVPAMAATLGIYIAAVVSMPLLRRHLVPARHFTVPLNTLHVHEFMFSRNGSMHIVADGGPAGSWLLSNDTVTPAGHVFNGPANPQFCGVPDLNQGPKRCMEWVSTLNLRQDIVYQPGSHFWPLQWAETGIYVTAAVLLAGFCFYWARRRLV